MAEHNSGCRKAFKFGCIGCLGLLVLLLVVIGLVLGFAWSSAQDQEIERQDFSQVLTAPEVLGIEDEPADLPGEFVAPKPAGRVVLDLRNTFFEIRPARPGEPLRVKAEFDVNDYELSQSYEEAEDGWVYEVMFKRTSDSYLVSVLKEAFGGSKPELTVYLPTDVPFDLELDVRQGGAEVELGGLWLTNAEIRFLQGGGAVEISEPLQGQIDYLGIDFTQGGGAIDGVAKASPSVLEVSFSMGGGALDLSGSWQRDASIDISQSMGGVSVELPENVIIRGLGRYDTDLGEGEESELPVLRFSTSSSMGELEFVR